MAIGFLNFKWAMTRKGPEVAKRANVEELSADTTLDAADSGKILLITATGKTITLPATAVGLCYTIMSAKDGIALAVSPNSADKILGLDLTGADNKDKLCTSRKGDYIKIIADGSLGWYVMEAVGTWTEEG